MANFRYWAIADIRPLGGKGPFSIVSVLTFASSKSLRRCDVRTYLLTFAQVPVSFSTHLKCPGIARIAGERVSEPPGAAGQVAAGQGEKGLASEND